MLLIQRSKIITNNIYICTTVKFVLLGSFGQNQKKKKKKSPGLLRFHTVIFNIKPKCTKQNVKCDLTKY